MAPTCSPWKPHNVFNMTNGFTYILISPNFPEPYTNRLRCLWSVQAEEGFSILFNLHRFKLEDKNDVFSIGDGIEPGLHVILARSGTTKLRTVYSISNRIWMTLETNEMNALRGFVIYMEQFNHTGNRESFKKFSRRNCSAELVPFFGNFLNFFHQYS